MYSTVEDIFNSALIKSNNNDDSLEQGKEYSTLQNTIFSDYTLNLSNLEKTTGDNVKSIIEPLETNNVLKDNNNNRSENLNELYQLLETYDKSITELTQLNNELVNMDNYKDEEPEVPMMKKGDNFFYGCKKFYQEDYECKKDCVVNCTPLEFIPDNYGKRAWETGENATFFQCGKSLYENKNDCSKNSTACAPAGCKAVTGSVIPKTNEESNEKIKQLKSRINTINARIQDLTVQLNTKSETLYSANEHVTDTMDKQKNKFNNQMQQLNHRKKGLDNLLSSKDNLRGQLEDIKLDMNSSYIGYILWLIAATTLGGIIITRMINK